MGNKSIEARGSRRAVHAVERVRRTRFKETAYPMIKKLTLGLLALSAVTFSARAQVNLELALVIDGSGSISTSDFNTQRTAYVNALNTVLPSHFGEVAIGVWQFSTGVSLVQTPLIVGNAADLLTLTSAISGMVQLGGNTNIAGGITTAANELLGNAITSNRQVLDVSTDGFANIGGSPDVAAANAVGNGIEQINGLGIGGAADLSFVAGAGAFAIQISDFSQLQGALETKIGREITGVPDSGSSFALLMMGVAGLVAFRRRMRNA